MVTVYAESNFLLELAYEQEEAGACEALLALAEAGRIALAIPVFALMEPLWTVPFRSTARSDKRLALQGVFREMQRSASFRREGLQVEADLKGLFERYEKAESNRFDHARERLLAAAKLLPMTGETLREARATATRFNLKDFDAVMLASVVLDLPARTPESYFLNRNKNDFDTPDIKGLLKGRGCKFVRGFSDGLARVQADLPA